MSPEVIVAGMVVGLAVAAPIGPMSILCLQRSFSHGQRMGLAIGLGAATMHLAWGTAAVFGFGAAGQLLGTLRTPMTLASALVLLWFAWSLAGRAAPLLLLPGTATTGAGLAKAYGEALLLGVTNPLTIVLLAATLPAIAPVPDAATAPLLVLGIFLGSLTWWAFLSLVAGRLRSRIKPAWLALTSRVASAGFACAAVALIVRVVGVV